MSADPLTTTQNRKRPPKKNKKISPREVKKLNEFIHLLDAIYCPMTALEQAFRKVWHSHRFLSVFWMNGSVE